MEYSVISMFKKKRKEYSVSYDPDIQYPVIKASICNGERVAGFKSKDDGHFTEVAFITSDKELKAFMDAYGLEEIKTEY